MSELYDGEEGYSPPALSSLQSPCHHAVPVEEKGRKGTKFRDACGYPPRLDLKGRLEPVDTLEESSVRALSVEGKLHAIG